MARLGYESVRLDDGGGSRRVIGFRVGVAIYSVGGGSCASASLARCFRLRKAVVKLCGGCQWCFHLV